MIMSSVSTQYSRFSLTDELAEATSELLDLGGAARQHQQASYSHAHRPPLPTPSPLNLSAPQTLSSIVPDGKNVKLELIHDDDDDQDHRIPSSPKKKKPTTETVRTSPPEGSASTEASSFDEDDKLPSSRLNSLVASVSEKSLHSTDSALSPNMRVVEEALHAPSWLSKGKARQTDVSTRLSSMPSVGSEIETSNTARRNDEPPSFFTESFPEFKATSEAEAAASESVAVVKPTPPIVAKKLASPRPTNPTVGEIIGSNITVKLHGNGRLQRESHEPTNQINDDDVIQELDRHHQHSDDGERSSLMSLPATSITDSSQNSSRGGARQRPIRRRSNSSYSVMSADLSLADDTVFARDVQIRGFNVVGEKARGFVCYDVRIITMTGTTISILRRFRSFCQLRQALVTERPQHAKLVPTLPPKTSGLLHKYASHHLEKRRKGLQKWLSIVMLDRRWATTKALREWVVGEQ